MPLVNYTRLGTLNGEISSKKEEKLEGINIIQKIHKIFLRHGTYNIM